MVLVVYKILFNYSIINFLNFHHYVGRDLFIYFHPGTYYGRNDWKFEEKTKYVWSNLWLVPSQGMCLCLTTIFTILITFSTNSLSFLLFQECFISNVLCLFCPSISDRLPVSLRFFLALSFVWHMKKQSSMVVGWYLATALYRLNSNFFLQKSHWYCIYIM